MLISARESSRILATSGISRQQSRRVLLTGLAGPSVCTRSALLYDDDAVRRIAAWRQADEAELLAACPDGVLVVRLGPGVEPDLESGWSAVADAVRVQPALGFPAWLQIRALLAVHRRLAGVVTVCGFPVLVADVVSFRSRDDDQVVFGLDRAGPWSALLHDRRLVTAPGPPWLVLGSQPYLGRAARARARGEAVGAGRTTTWTGWA